MPRVTIKKKQYMASDLNKFIRERMYEKGIRQREMAELLGIQQASFSNKLKKSMFSYMQLIMIFKKLEASDEDIVKAMKM